MQSCVKMTHFKLVVSQYLLRIITKFPFLAKAIHTYIHIV